MRAKFSFIFNPDAVTDEEAMVIESFYIYLERVTERMIELPRRLQVGFLKRKGYVRVLYYTETEELVWGE